jgi:acetyltransferase-like isoleucine patch superfamily enzyme
MDIRRALQSLRFVTIFSSVNRGKFVRKRHIFGAVGENVRLPFGIIPLRSENIYLHNNIEVASGAKFIPHDAIHSVFNNMHDANGRYEEHIGKIEVFDNVFIGANAIILGPCKIGPNAIVAAGAVVNKNVPEGSIVGGVPAKVIGEFEELRKKRMFKSTE